MGGGVLGICCVWFTLLLSFIHRVEGWGVSGVFGDGDVTVLLPSIKSFPPPTTVAETKKMEDGWLAVRWEGVGGDIVI